MLQLSEILPNIIMFSCVFNNFICYIYIYRVCLFAVFKYFNYTVYLFPINIINIASDYLSYLFITLIYLMFYIHVYDQAMIS